jgi:carboxypeptidase D
MRFSAVISLLILGAGLATAAGHSGRSLKHVGKEDKHHKHARRAAPEAPKVRREDQFQYLTNATQSKCFPFMSLSRDS